MPARLRIVLLALGWALSLSAAGEAPVRVAIIIDDLGNSGQLGRQAVELPGALTYAVLPRLPYSRTVARAAFRRGKEVMLHLPMQATDGSSMGPGGLHNRMNRVDFALAVHDNLAAVPYVSGVNNHMGSLLTRQPEVMGWLMQDLACFGDLYFVDSRTDVRTVARKLARQAGLANAQRDVFLDNEQNPYYVRRQLKRLIAKARRYGSAIGIGHPYPATLKVLAEQIPRLAEKGVELVPVSRLVETQRSEERWLACSSPLPTVAKNSKQ